MGEEGGMKKEEEGKSLKRDQKEGSRAKDLQATQTSEALHKVEKSKYLNTVSNTSKLIGPSFVRKTCQSHVCMMKKRIKDGIMRYDFNSHESLAIRWNAESVDSLISISPKLIDKVEGEFSGVV